MKVYLAGPIAGCNDSECRDWRNYVKTKFQDTLDPMRRDYRGKEGECSKEIVEADKNDIDQSSIIFAYVPKPSVGTSMEILYAWERKKYIVLIVPEGAPISPWLIYHSNKIVQSFEDGFFAVWEYMEDLENE
jgi:nucleoside 2-deoxyribosyltransferase